MGWTAIAKSANVSVKRARELAVRDLDQLPVLFDEKTKKPFAFLSAIEEWQKRATASLGVAERLAAAEKRPMKLHKWADIKRSAKDPARLARLEKRVQAEVRKIRAAKRRKGS
jgi:hypothetical protein